jgi:hypothetical protein
MKLFLISQNVNDGYDTWDSAVVAAEDEQLARMTHPSEYKNPWNGKEERYGGWCDAVHVKVEYLADAKPGSQAGVILASFNAG